MPSLKRLKYDEGTIHAREAYATDYVVWVDLRESKSARTVVLAEPEAECLYDEDHPEREGTVKAARSEVHVLADYDLNGDLTGVEIIGVPLRRENL